MEIKGFDICRNQIPEMTNKFYCLQTQTKAETNFFFFFFGSTIPFDLKFLAFFFYELDYKILHPELVLSLWFCSEIGFSLRYSHTL